MTDLFFEYVQTGIFPVSHCMIKTAGGSEDLVQKFQGARIYSDIRVKLAMLFKIVLLDLIQFIIIRPNRRADSIVKVKKFVVPEESIKTKQATNRVPDKNPVFFIG
jgi:hypothetical protein